MSPHNVSTGCCRCILISARNLSPGASFRFKVKEGPNALEVKEMIFRREDEWAHSLGQRRKFQSAFCWLCKFMTKSLKGKGRLRKGLKELLSSPPVWRLSFIYLLPAAVRRDLGTQFLNTCCSRGQVFVGRRFAHTARCTRERQPASLTASGPLSWANPSWRHWRQRCLNGEWNCQTWFALCVACTL